MSLSNFCPMSWFQYEYMYIVLWLPSFSLKGPDVQVEDNEEGEEDDDEVDDEEEEDEEDEGSEGQVILVEHPSAYQYML